jgi:Multiubiquitin
MSSEHENQHMNKDEIKSYNVVVNGRPRVVQSHKLSYDEVVRLAYPDATREESILYTVSYANPHGRDGTLVQGQEVTVKEGMVFNVVKTNRS